MCINNRILPIIYSFINIQQFKIIKHIMKQPNKTINMTDLNQTEQFGGSNHHRYRSHNHYRDRPYYYANRPYYYATAPVIVYDESPKRKTKIDRKLLIVIFILVGIILSLLIFGSSFYSYQYYRNVT